MPAQGKARSFGEPAWYRIVVGGDLGEEAVSCLGDLERVAPEPDQPPGTTMLLGQVRDQASLCGILQSLYDLRSTILVVSRLENHESQFAPPRK